MNIILIVADSLRRDHVGAFGGPAGRTPHLDQFGHRAGRFLNHFVGSLPTIPARREIYAGRREFLWRPWGPLEPFDDRLPVKLSDAGYRTAVVTDNYHYWERNANGYLQSFQSMELVRGNEHDNWKTVPPADEAVPGWVQGIERWRPGEGRRYYANVRGFQREEDYFSPRVMRGAAEWLERNAGGGPFFLHVESFDVHEPFHVPEPYASMYGDAADRDRYTVWVPYQNPGRLAKFLAATSPAELEFIRSQYLGKVAMLDRWLGRLFATIEQLGLWEDTAVIVTTDHGHDLGDHGRFGKEYPHFDSHANIPLMIWHPGYQRGPHQVDALTTTADLHATLLDIAGLTCGPELPSRSLLPLLQGDRASVHEGLIYGTFGRGIGCTDGEWTLLQAPLQDAPLHYYSTSIYRPPAAGAEDRIESGYFIPGVGLPQWKVPVTPPPGPSASGLYHRREDPGQERNRWDDAPGERRRMQELMEALVEEQGGCPPEQRVRFGLDRAGAGR